MHKYVLGVDGGNTKTEYFLFTTGGHMVDGLRKGTCSHERFPGGYKTAKQVMNRAIRELLSRHRLGVNDLSAAAFGLAGADLPHQKENLTRVLKEIGFTRFEVDNDGFLGVKAGCRAGYGICHINGTGSVCAGIGMDGRRVQVGGIGSELTGDEAGGHYLAIRAVRTVYDELFRACPQTSMTAPVLALLNVSKPEDMLETVCLMEGDNTLPTTELMRTLFEACDTGDAMAQAIVRHCAESSAQTTLGCLQHLDITGEASIVQAGSVWARAETPLLSQWYREKVQKYANVPCKFHILNEPPATGAVLWALELERGQPADDDVTKRVFEEVQAFKGKLQQEVTPCNTPARFFRRFQVTPQRDPESLD
ncbi:MAG: N-acetylglucosamine kinase [Clostridia bacterium]|nr:N-acetylglucosamine kinase [Clostridia bacterium]